ncbi:MAG: glycosyltransferase [Candidatus Edwardsbacteria bacterium]|jgi:glycosyltransferase involved in cell wall biosynthesis|nr:glycosyltransferase [Candidatus Edwardsbacteria bacterium]
MVGDLHGGARVLAVSAIEAPFRGTLVRTQLLAPLARLRRRRAGFTAEYLALVPWTFFFGRRRPWRTLAANVRRLRRLRDELDRSGIALRVRPVPFPLLPRQYNLSRTQRLLFTAGAFPALLSFLLVRRRYDLVLARSYPAALLAGLARRASGVPYLFDLRGMYPEEGVNAGAFGAGSRDYHDWKRIERRLIGDAARCIVVSRPFAAHVRAIAPGARVDVIPCCVDPDAFRCDEAARARAKAAHALAGRFVLLHLGSFGAPGDRGLAGKYLLRFRRAQPNAVLVVASGTPAFGPAIDRALRDEGLVPGDYRIIHPAGEQVGEVLALGDAGLILERRTANTKVCLPVKLGEYLASGLPVICTPHVEGTAGLVTQYDCGLVVDPDGDEPISRERAFLEQLPRLRRNGFRLVDEVLSIDRCAAQWSETITTALAHREER